MDTEVLKSSLQALVRDPSLASSNGTTFCNIGVARIADLFGIKDFNRDAMGDPPLANQICALLADSKDFKKADSAAANSAASKGNFVIAAHPYAGHGHVATVYPSPEMFYSPSWNKEVPFVANVGKTNGIMPTSHAFPVALNEPYYYVYEPAAIQESTQS